MFLFKRNKKKCSSAHQMGAYWDGDGVHFCLYSEYAVKIEVCLFGVGGQQEERRVDLQKTESNLWIVYIPKIGPGEQYGYRVSGPWAPKSGHRFNSSKLLLDPYAKSVIGEFSWRPEVYPYQGGDNTIPEYTDNANWVPRSCVIDPVFDWQNDSPPNIPMLDTVIYETHIKGFTQLHPDVPEEDRGTYLGMAAPAVINYLKIRYW